MSQHLPQDEISKYRDELSVGVDRVRDLLGPVIGLDLTAPVTTRGVIFIAAALGFDIGTKSIDSAFQRGRITKPEKVGREFRWTDAQLLDLLLDAERRRSWLPGSKTHWHKMTAFERVESDRRLAEVRAQFGSARAQRPDYARLTSKQLIVEAVDGETPELRRWAIHCFRTKLLLRADPLDEMTASALRNIADDPNPERRAQMGALILGWLVQTSLADVMVLNMLARQSSEEKDIEPPPPVEPKADTPPLSREEALELLDKLEKPNLSRDRVRSLVEALTRAPGLQSNDGADRHAVRALLDRVFDGDREAIAKARVWIVENTISHLEDE